MFYHKTIRVLKRHSRHPGWVTFVTVLCTLTQTLWTIRGGLH